MEFNALNNVTYLNLSSNQLSRVPPVICHLAQLRVLDLSHNRLSELPQELIGNVQLEVLNISYNRFIQVSSVIPSLTHLHSLNISNNQIGVLPSFLTNPYQMRLYYFLSSGFEQWNLNVSGNPIRSIHCILDNLEGIDMDRIEEIELSLQDWMVSHCTLTRLDTRVVCWYVNNGIMIVAMFIAAIFVIPIGWVLQSLRDFSFVNRCISIMRTVFEHPVAHISFFCMYLVFLLPAGLIFLVGSLVNASIWSINMFITGVIGPIIGLARELLGYPPTIRLR
jgi:hypothetical protein